MGAWNDGKPINSLHDILNHIICVNRELLFYKPTTFISMIWWITIIFYNPISLVALWYGRLQLDTASFFISHLSTHDKQLTDEGTYAHFAVNWVGVTTE